VDTCEVFFDVIDVIDDAYGDDPATAFPGLLTVEGNSSNPCT